jgi:hypothetical protein
MTSPTLDLGLSFDAATHEYRVGERRLPSVTEIMRVVGFASDYRFNADRKYRDRGHAVHMACQLVDANNYDRSRTHPEIVPYVDQYEGFVKLTGFKGRVWELALADPKAGFAGTLDVIGEARGELWMIDLKSGATLPKAVGVQTAAYDSLVSGNGHIINMDLDPATREWFMEARRQKTRLKRKSLQLEAKPGPGTLRGWDESEWVAWWASALVTYHGRRKLGML